MKLSSRRSRATRRQIVPWMFAAPAAVLFLAFMLIPIIYAVYLSFRGARLAGGGGGYARPTQTFIGLTNYIAAFTDPVLRAGVGHALIFGVIAVPTTLGLALLFALLIDAPSARLQRFSRTAIFLPYAVPGVIASLLWGFLYLPSPSPFSDLSRGLGLGQFNPLTSSGIFLAVANVAVRGGTGFNMVVLYTSLRAIPSELYDAARIDGCGEWRLA